MSITRRAARLSPGLRRLGLAGTLGLAVLPALPALAQNMFAPVAYVNDQVVTRFELDQRRQMLAVLGAPTTEKAALEALIEERLKDEVAARVGMSLNDEQTAAAIREFAARGDLQPEQFLALMARNGVSAQTVRDYITSGTIWREYARARFRQKATVSESEIDRALQNQGPSGGLRVLLSELFLPARTPEERAQSEALATRIAQDATIGSFAAAAREYSVAPSRETGGEMDWVPIGNLPGPLRASVMGLKPGEVTAPLSTGNAIGMFQLRAVAETDVPTPAPDTIRYAAYYIAGGHSPEALKRAAEVQARVDTCDDLYAVAKGQPESTLQIDSLSPSQIPQDVALELAKLDPGEVSTALTRANGQTLVFLMLCARSFDEATDEEAREQVRQELIVNRISALADSYVAELKADAAIVIP
ncbi:peptidylprolyl isomerase [Celeribacter indicus]|uniref:Parvulin-like PPIase n=2 Tax=Celeribacter indicus TaxID=1208324 RepID=A0A0B5E2X2_9RHOB|nr:peptidylprolyl isomerase [Celeribacter indicus]AJE47376.1 chaperone surA [Celeribacter indicus]SDW04954.1 periplasmic chaperone for outer membrane proteins SurA [Celeribacter indicus]